MRLLYPADPFESRKIDETYSDEYVASAANISCSIVSLEALADGKFHPRPALKLGEVVLYRGWMMTGPEYIRLSAAVEQVGARLMTSTKQYLTCHHLPGWYSSCTDLTPQTLVVTVDTDFDTLVQSTKWSGYFVKDFVKSLTTTRGSIARSAAEIREIVALIAKCQIEGGICLRELEPLRAETEERHFVFRGDVFTPNGEIPEIVKDVAKRIDAPFFSVDIAQRDDGQWRLVEIGDGQVSDRKHWSAEQFVTMLTTSPAQPAVG